MRPGTDSMMRGGRGTYSTGSLGLNTRPEEQDRHSCKSHTRATNLDRLIMLPLYINISIAVRCLQAMIATSVGLKWRDTLSTDSKVD
jgi:hypothetical protein